MPAGSAFELRGDDQAGAGHAEPLREEGLDALTDVPEVKAHWAGELAMDYVKVARESDLAEGQVVPVEAGGRKLLVARAGGAIYAAQRKCPHLGFNLCRGSIEDAAIVCPLHKAKFDLASGEIERDPKLLFIKMTAKSKLQTYPVRIEAGDVLVGV